MIDFITGLAIGAGAMSLAAIHCWRGWFHQSIELRYAIGERDDAYDRLADLTPSRDKHGRFVGKERG